MQTNIWKGIYKNRDEEGNKLYRNIFTLTIGVLSICNLYGQTCIIAKKTKDAIYLGSDSRFLRTYKYTDGSSKVDTGQCAKYLKKGFIILL